MSSGEHGSTSQFPRVFLICFALVFVAMAVFSFAMPLLSGPDEQTHTIKATGVVRGQFTGNCHDRPFTGPTLPPCPSSGPLGSLTEVHVPAFYAVLKPDNHVASEANLNLECESGRSTQPANCIVFPKPAIFAGIARYSWIYDGRYPPLYYAIVGLPSLLGEGNWALYLMRLAGALACAFFVALAAASVWVWSRRRLVLVGIVLGATPMVLYLGGVVNPSGLEAATAISLWSAGSVLVLERRNDPPRGLVAVVGVSAAALALVRSLSPLWLAVCLVVLCLLAGGRAVIALLSRRQVRWAAALALLGTALALSWTVYEHATNVKPPTIASAIPSRTTPLSTLVFTALRHNSSWVPTLIGVFGKFDTRLPLFSYAIWYVLLGVVVLGALFVGSRRESATLVALLLGIVLIPTLIVLSHVHVDGYLWNGRDTLPLAVGLPIVASAIIDARSSRLVAATVRRSVIWVLVLAGIAQFGALYEALRRYSVGTSGAVVGFLAHPVWSPPVGVVLPLLVQLGVLVLSAVLIVRSLRERDEASRSSLSADHPFEVRV